MLCNLNHINQNLPGKKQVREGGKLYFKWAEDNDSIQATLDIKIYCKEIG